jgi:4-hydroxybenzoate polyprenyltransferase
LDFKILINLIRVRQWYKNVIIFLPLVFSFDFFVLEKLGIIVLGFVALSLVSSSMYIRNDIKDLKSDKMHPTKKFRPLAAGIFSIKQTWIFSILLFISGLLIGFFLEPLFSILLILLFFNTEVYSRWTKKILFLDVFAIGINFIIRAVSGIILLNVSLSPWIILGVFFVALFLAFVKRKSEMITLEDNAKEHRGILDEYTVFSLNASLLIAAVMVIITYSIYAINGPTGDWRLVLTVPFILFVILRQIYISNINNEKLKSFEVLKDRPSLFAIIAYSLFTLFLLYYVPSEIFLLGYKI